MKKQENMTKRKIFQLLKKMLHNKNVQEKKLRLYQNFKNKSLLIFSFKKWSSLLSLLVVKKNILKNLFKNLKFHQKLMIFQGFNSLVLYNKFCLLQENLNKTAEVNFVFIND